MASKHNPDKAQKTPARAADPKARDELDVKDLDKVTGGLRKSGGAKRADPCDGGE
jgi:hypothetical protein